MESIFKAAEKWDFVTKCEGWVYSGDKELLETAADARYNKDGSRNYDISGTLFSMMYRDLGDARSRGNKLDELRRKLEDVPEQNRSEAQSKALQLVEKQISRIPVIEECEKFAKAASGHGWPAAESTLRSFSRPERDCRKTIRTPSSWTTSGTARPSIMTRWCRHTATGRWTPSWAR